MNYELKEDETSPPDEKSNEKIKGRFSIQEVNEEDVVEDIEFYYKNHKKSCSFSNGRFYYAVDQENYPEDKPNEYYIYNIKDKIWGDIQILYSKLKEKNKKIEDVLMKGIKSESLKKIENYSISPFKKLETPKKKLYKSFEMEFELNEKIINSLEFESPTVKKRVKYKYTTPSIPIVRRLSTNVVPFVKSSNGVYKSKLCSLATGLLRIGNKKVKEVNLIFNSKSKSFCQLGVCENISFSLLHVPKLCNDCLYVVQGNQVLN